MEESHLVKEGHQYEVVSVAEEMERGRRADVDQKEYNCSMSVSWREAETVVKAYTETTTCSPS